MSHARRWGHPWCEIYTPAVSKLVPPLICFHIIHILGHFVHALQVVFKVISPCKCLHVTRTTFVHTAEVHSWCFMHALLMPVSVVWRREPFHSAASTNTTSVEFLVLYLVFRKLFMSGKTLWALGTVYALDVLCSIRIINASIVKMYQRRPKGPTGSTKRTPI